MGLLSLIQSLFGQFQRLIHRVSKLRSSESVNTSPQADDELTLVPFSDKNEQLYRRIAASFKPRGGRFDAAAFRLQLPKPDEPPSGLSFNRSSMNGPASVLKGQPGESVASVRVGAVTRSITAAGETFTLSVEHKPITGNRSHSEIRAYDHASVFHAYPANDDIRKAFREEIARVAEPVPLPTTRGVTGAATP